MADFVLPQSMWKGGTAPLPLRQRCHGTDDGGQGSRDKVGTQIKKQKLQKNLSPRWHEPQACCGAKKPIRREP